MKKAMLWKKEPEGDVRCLLCSHMCRIPEGSFGHCGMRQCEGGDLFTHSYGEVIASHVDPIEKKPLYHFLPGTDTYSVAAMGCNFTCSYCQNWRISTLSASKGDSEGKEMTPQDIVAEALRSGTRSVSYTYTEPTVFFEYAYETSKKASENGLRNVFVTNGYLSVDAVEEISPFLNAANVDLKFFSEDTYRRMCGASLKPVLDTIIEMKNSGIWVEVTTLVIPGVNDSEKELRSTAKFLSSLDRDIPWHVSRFHPDHKEIDIPATSPEKLFQAKTIGVEEGLRHVYVGNVSGKKNTSCPGCGNVLVERSGAGVKVLNEVFVDGKCLVCGAVVAGIWS